MPRRDLKPMVGLVFGDRTVIAYAGEKKWNNVCRCGREYTTDGADLRRRQYECDHVLADRFWKKVEKTSTCWIWTATTDDGGYGQFNDGGNTRLAHVVAWEEINGKVPNGFELDHLCRNHPCVRHDHLEPVTHAENVRRGRLGEVTRARMAQLRGESVAAGQ